MISFVKHEQPISTYFHIICTFLWKTWEYVPILGDMFLILELWALFWKICTLFLRKCCLFFINLSVCLHFGAYTLEFFSYAIVQTLSTFTVQGLATNRFIKRNAWFGGNEVNWGNTKLSRGFKSVQKNTWSGLGIAVLYIWISGQDDRNIGAKLYAQVHRYYDQRLIAGVIWSL